MSKKRGEKRDRNRMQLPGVAGAKHTFCVGTRPETFRHLNSSYAQVVFAWTLPTSFVSCQQLISAFDSSSGGHSRKPSADLCLCCPTNTFHRFPKQNKQPKERPLKGRRVIFFFSSGTLSVITVPSSRYVAFRPSLPRPEFLNCNSW